PVVTLNPRQPRGLNMVRLSNSAAARRCGDSASSLRQEAMGRAVQRWFETLEERRLMAAVNTDQGDYHFGTIAHVSGTEFAPAEPVALQVTHVEGTPGSNDDAQNMTWVVQADAEGSVNTDWAVTDPDAINASYVLTARGLDSGLTATAYFT